MASKAGQETASSEQVEELLDTVATTLDRLKTLYEQYFLGIQKQAPSFIHTDVERKLRDLTQLSIRNTGLRYRLATLQQKFGSYNAYWRRTLRQIENGTYTRNLAKLGRDAARNGAEIPEEILAAMPKRMREQVLRDRDQAIATAKRRKQIEDEAAGVVPEEPESSMSTISDDESEYAEPVHEIKKPAGKTSSGAYRLDDDDSEIDFNAMFSAFDDDAPKTHTRGKPTTKTKIAPKSEPKLDAPNEDAVTTQTITQPVPRPQLPRMPLPGDQQARAGAVAAPSGTTSAQQPPSGTTSAIPRPVAGQPGTGGVPRAAGPQPGSAGVPRAAGPQPGSAGVPRPAGPQPGSGGVPRPVGQQPSAPTASAIPRAAEPQPGSGAVPRPVGQQPSAPTSAIPRAAGPQPGSGAVPRPVGQQPSAPTSAIPRPAIPQPPSGAVPRPAIPQPPSGAVPRPVGQQASGPAGAPGVARPTPAAGIPRPTPAAGIPRPTPSGGIPPGTQTGPMPAVTQPIPHPAGQQGSGPTSVPRPTPAGMPRPQTGPAPMVTQPIPRPAPSQQSRPIPVAPGAAAQTGPVPVESMAGPFPRTAAEKPAPTTQLPKTPPQTQRPTQSIPKPATTTTQSAPKPPQKPPPGMTDADVNALHAKYVKAKEMVGEKVDPGSREKLLKTINQTAPKIMEQYKASGVDFSVIVKDNQVIIKAKPKT